MFEFNYISVVVLILTLIILWKYISGTSRLPPGPRALPLIGNIFNLDIKDMIGTYDKMREKYGDIFSVYIGNQLQVVISGYENIKEAMVTNGDMFPDRPTIYMFEKITNGLGIMGTNGNIWKEQRMFALQTLREFGFGKRSMEGKIIEEVRIFLEALEETAGQPYDARYLAKVSISNLICAMVFGYTRDHRDTESKEIIAALEKNFELMALAAPLNFIPILRYIPGDPFKTSIIMKNTENGRKRILKTIQEHKETFEENNIRDFIDAYIKEIRRRGGDKNHYFSEDQLVSVIQDLFAAGTESTSETIIWAILYLIHNPQIQDKMKSEIDEVVGSSRFPSMNDKHKLPYCEAVANEVLRIGDLSPFASPRSSSHDVTFKGYVIPKGSIVLPNTHSIMTDPEIFKNPEKFDPTRFLDEDGLCSTKESFIPFGVGKRVCTGEKLARMELFLFLTSIVQRFTLLPEKNKPLPSLEGVFRVTRTAKPFKFCAIKRH